MRKRDTHIHRTVEADRREGDGTEKVRGKGRGDEREGGASFTT